MVMVHNFRNYTEGHSFLRAEKTAIDFRSKKSQAKSEMGSPF
jgi:hypothetical protein